MVRIWRTEQNSFEASPTQNIDWKSFMSFHMKLLPHRPREIIVSGVFNIGLGDQFDDDRRRIPERRST
jgi:hypothetical protein